MNPARRRNRCHLRIAAFPLHPADICLHCQTLPLPGSHVDPGFSQLQYLYFHTTGQHISPGKRCRDPCPPAGNTPDNSLARNPGDVPVTARPDNPARMHIPHSETQLLSLWHISCPLTDRRRCRGKGIVFPARPDSQQQAQKKRPQPDSLKAFFPLIPPD